MLGWFVFITLFAFTCWAARTVVGGKTVKERVCALIGTAYNVLVLWYVLGTLQ